MLEDYLMFTSSKVEGIVSERVYNVTEQLEIIHTHLEVTNFSYLNRYKARKTTVI